MAPILSRGVASYLAPPTNEEDQYTYPDPSVDGSEDTSGNDRNAYGKVEDDEGHESSPNALKNDRHLIDKRSASTPETLDATNGTLFRRLEWDRVGSKSDYRNSMDTMYGSDFSPRPPPWPTDKTIFAFGQKDKNGKDLAETATFAKCINDFPNTLSTCEINGVPGVDYWKMLVERIDDLATSHDRPASELAFEELTDIAEEIVEAPCNIQKLCRRVLHRQTDYHRRPEGGTDPRYVAFNCVFMFCDRADACFAGLISVGNRSLKMGHFQTCKSQQRHGMGQRMGAKNLPNRFRPWNHSIAQSATIPLQYLLNSLAHN